MSVRQEVLRCALSVSRNVSPRVRSRWPIVRWNVRADWSTCGAFCIVRDAGFQDAPLRCCSRRHSMSLARCSPPSANRCEYVPSVCSRPNVRPYAARRRATAPSAIHSETVCRSAWRASGRLRASLHGRVDPDVVPLRASYPAEQPAVWGGRARVNERAQLPRDRPGSVTTRRHRASVLNDPGHVSQTNHVRHHRT